MPDQRAIPVVGSLALAAALLLGTSTREACAGEAGAGFEAYVDPNTGELVEEPVGIPRSLSGDAAVAPDGAPLVEEPSPAGGVSVELRGAFRSSVTATVAPDGRVETKCDGGQATGKACK